MKTLCNNSMQPAILDHNHIWNIYADFGKDKNTNDNDLLTYSISSQLYSKGGLFNFKMLTLDHIANNPLCNKSTKNRTIQENAM